MDATCSDCHQKDDLINKYLKLIKLLKTKCQKTAKSFVKNNTLPSDTLYETSLQNSGSLSSNIQLNFLKSNINPQKNNNQDPKSCQLHLALTIMVNKLKKSLLKQSFEQIKEPIRCQLQSNASNYIQSLNLQGSIHSIIQQTLSYGKILQTQSKSSQSNIKDLHTRIFNLEVQNVDYMKKIALMQKQIEDSQKRFMKQTQKKRQSLQTVAQQIRQKTEMIVQMHHTIKRYQRALGRSLQNVCVKTVLIEDAQELKKTCIRLQNINQKLNDDVRNLQTNIESLSKQLFSLKTLNFEMKQQNKTLKEKVFDMSHQLDQQQQTQKLYKRILNKFNKKIEALKLKEKQLCSQLKQNNGPNSMMKSEKIISTKNSDISGQQFALERKFSVRELEAEQKIEEIFAFLFNIHVQNYKMNNENLFDEDEATLLKSHKDIFLTNVKQNSFTNLKRQPLKKNIKLEQSNFRQTDEIFYVKKQQINEQDSFLCALQQKPQQQLNESPRIDNMRFIDLQIQKSKLIEKISQLKNLHMHIRNVVLNFLKTLDLSTLRPQSCGILQVVFEFFQYSQDEKVTICRQKKKKFWGIL